MISCGNCSNQLDSPAIFLSGSIDLFTTIHDLLQIRIHDLKIEDKEMLEYSDEISQR